MNKSDAQIRAEAMFDRLIGRTLSESVYEQNTTIKDRLVPLKESPFGRLISVKGRTEAWDYANYFGSTHWLNIDLERIATYDKDGKTFLELPPSVYGTPFTEVSVTYTAGLKETPKDVQDALQTLATLLEKRKIDEWTSHLPDSVRDVIDAYRKEVT